MEHVKGVCRVTKNRNLSANAFTFITPIKPNASIGWGLFVALEEEVTSMIACIDTFWCGYALDGHGFKSGQSARKRG